MKINENWLIVTENFFIFSEQVEELSMKYLGKMYLKVILKVTENQGFILTLVDTFFEKPQGFVG